MRPAWSVLLFTTLAGAGQGLYLVLLAAQARGALLQTGLATAFALLAAGLVASFFHLGHPERAWRAVAMWRTSWLSREVIVLPAFMVLVAAYAWTQSPLVGMLGVLACLALFACTGMIYACLPFLQEWRSPLTLLNFTLLGFASGATLAAALAAALEPALARGYALAALAAGAAAYLGRLASLVRNARLRPKSTLASATGIPQRPIVQMSQGAMGGSFNTREFFHGRPREVVRAVRWTLLALVFPVPAALLLTGQAAPAFLLQFAGLLAERWYFFAEAKHPQNLYYQAIA